MNALLKDLDQFAELSGLKPNYDKCIILRLGSLHGTTFKLSCNPTLMWSDGPIDILGIYISKRIDELIKINFNRTIFKNLSPSPFFKDMIQAWLHFQYFPPESVDAILQQMIWFNSNILINRLPILWEHFVEKSIIFVNDVMDLNGNIHSYKTFCELFGKLCSEFRYYQLVAAIPLVKRKRVKNPKKKIVGM